MKASAYRFAAAAALCLAALLASEQDRVTTLRTAAALIDHGDLGQAAAALQQLLAHSADDPLALNLLGVVRMREGRPREAEQLFLHAAENGPQFPGPHVNLAELYGAARWREALQQLHEALKLSPGHQQASAVLRRITKEAASDALKAGDGSGALSVIEEARQIAPDDAAILYEAGLVETQLKSYAPAEKALRQVLHLDPAYADAMYALARTCLSENRAADAESWMREYLKLRPNDATALYGLGYILMSEQKTGDARAAFEASLKMRPEQTESLFQLGEAALRDGEEQRGKDYFEKVLARDSGHAGALTEMAVFDFQAGQYDAAANRLEKAIQRAPEYPKAHYYYALVLKKLGRNEEAARQFGISTELQKKEPRLELPQ